MRTRAEAITHLKLENHTYDVDGSGYLTDPGDWDEVFARHTAGTEQIELVALHWEVFGFMHAYLAEHGIAADVRFVLGFLAETQNTDKAGARKIMFDLFPYGYVQQACKIAGMRQPRAWSTG